MGKLSIPYSNARRCANVEGSLYKKQWKPGRYHYIRMIRDMAFELSMRRRNDNVKFSRMRQRER